MFSRSIGLRLRWQGRLHDGNRPNHEHQNQDPLLVVTTLSGALFLPEQRKNAAEYFLRFFRSNPFREEGLDNQICRAQWNGVWLQRIKEREQLLLLLFSEFSEVSGHVLRLASVPFNSVL
jgi:hypothetical protein